MKTPLPWFDGAHLVEELPLAVPFAALDLARIWQAEFLHLFRFRFPWFDRVTFARAGNFLELP
jgi:hypothetical protein